MKIREEKSRKKLPLLLLLVVFISNPTQVHATTCAIDNTLPETAAGNSYECPDTLEDGSPNEYNTCCWNDRPDESGNYHTCCKDEAAASAEKMGKFYNICIGIGCVTAGLMAGVFCCTYCKEDTFSFIAPIKRSCRRWYNIFMDAICFCSCLPKRFRRSEKKDGMPESSKSKKKNNAFDMPPSGDDQVIVMDPFWT